MNTNIPNNVNSRIFSTFTTNTDKKKCFILHKQNQSIYYNLSDFMIYLSNRAGLMQGFTGAETSASRPIGGPRGSNYIFWNKCLIIKEIYTVYSICYIYIYVVYIISVAYILYFFTTTANHRKTQDPALNKSSCCCLLLPAAACCCLLLPLC